MAKKHSRSRRSHARRNPRRGHRRHSRRNPSGVLSLGGVKPVAQLRGAAFPVGVMTLGGFANLGIGAVIRNKVWPGMPQWASFAVGAATAVGMGIVFRKTKYGRWLMLGALTEEGMRAAYVYAPGIVGKITGEAKMQPVHPAVAAAQAKALSEFMTGRTPIRLNEFATAGELSTVDTAEYDSVDMQNM